MPSITTSDTIAETPTQQTLPVTTSPPADDPIVKMTPAQMKERLDETRSATEKALLKKLGYESVSAAEKANKAFKDWQDGQLNEQQKLAKQLEELKPAAERVKALEGRYAAMVAKQLAALPDSIRTAIEKTADTPESIESLINAFEASGAIELARKAAGPPPAVPPATNTAPPQGAPKPGAVKSRFEQWQDLENNAATRMLGAAFYTMHRAEIERSRPTG